MKTLNGVALMFCALVLSWWTTDYRAPLEYSRSTPINEIVRPGSYLHLRTEKLRLRQCGGRVETYIYDSHNNKFTLADRDFKATEIDEGLEDFNQFFKVDDKAAYGPARIVFVVTWECNPVHIKYPIIRVYEANFTIGEP